MKRIVTVLFVFIFAINIATLVAAIKSPRTGANHDAYLMKFKQWAQTYITKKNAYTIRDWGSDGQRGVFATEDIKEGQQLLSLNWVSTLNLDIIAVEQKTFFEKMEEEVEGGLSDEDVLVLSLMMYRYCMTSDTYDLKAWVKALPADTSSFNSALYFSKQELEYLKGSPGFVHALLVQSEASELFEKLENSLFKDPYVLGVCKEHGTFTWEDFQWAHSIVSSRKIYIKSSEEERLIALVPPYIDFINHNSDPNTVIDFQEQSGMVVLTASKPIKKGEQLYLSYGTHQDCNSDFLIDYGFIDEESPKNCVNVLYEELYETIQDSDPKKNEKIFILDKVFEKEIRLKLFKGSLTEDLLKISKYLSYKQESLLEYLKGLIDLKLNHYPTRLQDDELFLLSTEYQTLSTRSQLAFKTSLQEKRILQFVKDDLQNSINDIDIKETAQPPKPKSTTKDEL
ncbi:hypothetical protein CYY_003029 [Polysphondylium violaceum]|uniref:SET domain-containing protein n=1 Tax=Polysphondylium violaceum TaxID=133409 RepID=A0A8J4Q797_9MYCE|nr:hypothetical protein CYY_003029 [Polysphondylium violaceum]